MDASTYFLSLLRKPNLDLLPRILSVFPSTRRGILMHHWLSDLIKIHYHSPGMNLEESFTFGSRWNMRSHKLLCNVCCYDRCCHLLAAMCSQPREHAPMHCITYLALTPALMRRIFTRNSRRGRTCARLFRPHKNVLGVEYLTYDFLG